MCVLAADLLKQYSEGGAVRGGQCVAERCWNRKPKLSTMKINKLCCSSVNFDRSREEIVQFPGEEVNALADAMKISHANYAKLKRKTTTTTEIESTL